MRKFNYSHTYIFSKLVFIGLTVGLLVFACARKPTEIEPASPKTPIVENAININTASAEELAKIPHIGEKAAAKIVEHREKYGPFRRPEHLMLVDGISDKKFRLIRSLIKTE